MFNNLVERLVLIGGALLLFCWMINQAWAYLRPAMPLVVLVSLAATAGAAVFWRRNYW